MDFKKLLESMDTLSEAVHKGNYGTEYQPEEKRDEYGHRIPVPKKATEPVGAPSQTDKFAGSTSGLSGAFGSRLPADDNKHMKAFKTRKHTPMKNADDLERKMEKQLRGERGSIKEGSLRDMIAHIEESRTLNEMQPLMPLVSGNQQTGPGQTNSDPKSQLTTQQALQQQQADKSGTTSPVQQQNANKAMAQLKSIPGAKFSNPGNTLKVLQDPQAAMNNPSLKNAAAELGAMSAAQAGDPNAQNKSVQALKTLAGDQKMTAQKPGAVASMSESKKFKALTQLIESINFQDLIKNADQDVENMLAELQADVEEFKTTGHCSDLLDSFLKVHFHHAKEKQGAIQHDPLLGDVEEGAYTQHYMDANKPSLVRQKAEIANAPSTPTSFKTDPIQAVTDRAINAGSKGLGFLKGLGKNTPIKTFEGKTMKDIQLESWETQLNSLLTEGITVSTSKGQEGAPDSVSINATDADAEQLMTILRNSGMDGFGGGVEQGHQGHEEMSMHQPEGNGNTPEPSPEVAGDDGDILSLIKKMAGGATVPGTAEVEVDYEPEDTHANIEADDQEQATAGSEMGDMMKKMSDIESGEDREEPCDDCGHSPCDCDSHDHGSDNHKEQDGTEKSDDSEEDKEVKEANDGNLANNAKPYGKITQGDVVAGRLGKDEEGGHEACNECGMYECECPSEQAVAENIGGAITRMGKALDPARKAKAQQMAQRGQEMQAGAEKKIDDMNPLRYGYGDYDPEEVARQRKIANRGARMQGPAGVEENIGGAITRMGKALDPARKAKAQQMAQRGQEMQAGAEKKIDDMNPLQYGADAYDPEEVVRQRKIANRGARMQGPAGVAEGNEPEDLGTVAEINRLIAKGMDETDAIHAVAKKYGDNPSELASFYYQHNKMSESYANSNDDTAFQDLQYMIKTLSGGINGPKHSQATGNIHKVTMEDKMLKDSTSLLVDFQKLSGIK